MPPAADRQSRRVERRLRRLSQPSRRHRVRQTRRLAVAIGGLAVLATVLSLIGWLELRSPRRDVMNARVELTSVLDSSASLTTSTARADALTHVDKARLLLDRASGKLRRSWTLKLARNLPVLRAYANGTRTLTDGAAEASVIARDLLTRVNDVASRRQVSGGAVPLDVMAELATQFRTSADAIGRLRTPPHRLWGQLGDASAEFRRLQRDGPDRLRSGADVLDVGARFLGSREPRRYFVAAQNNAEMRDQGMVLSYAEMRAESGRLDLTRHGHITDLAVKAPVDVPLPEGTRRTFSDAPRQMWQNVNITADFTLSGRLMVALYKQAADTGVDGVVALDVPALSRLLSVVGAVRIPGVAEELNPDNASRILLHDLYDGYESAAVSHETRYERTADAVTAIIDKMRSGSFDVAAVGVALADAARGGHFRLYSTRPDEQKVFEQRGLSGGPALVAADRTFHINVQNATATKLDYFIRPRVAMDVVVDRDGTARVRTRITIENPVPRNAAPSFQLGPDGINTTKPGQYSTRVDLWAPFGSELPDSVVESGLQLYQQVLTVQPSTSEVVEFNTIIRNAVRDGELRLRFVPQPRLEAMPLTVRLETTGWSVKGPRSVGVAWDRTIDLRWRLER